MKNIHLSYGSTKALNGVDFDLYEGEIHAIIGEHRAGKSSLVRILSGDVVKQAGEIILNNRSYDGFTLQSAVAHGIGIVYQDVHIVPRLTAVENIYAGRMLRKWYGAIDRKRMVRQCRDLFGRLNVDIDLRRDAGRLSTSEQHMIEVAKSLLHDPQILILDELNNRLTPNEMKIIYRLLFELKKRGKSIIYISGDLDEILTLADRVTILRSGYRRGTELTRDLDRYKLFQRTYSFAVKEEGAEQDQFSLLVTNKYLENLIQNLPVGALVLDHDDKIRLVNYRALDIFDIDQDTIGSRSIHELLNELAPEQRAEIWTRIRERAQFHWEGVAAGDGKTLEVTIFPLFDENGAFIATTVLLQDVSLDRYIEEYLIMTEKMSSVAEVAAGVAHEINNPLCSVKNYLSLIQKDELDEAGKTRLLLIEKEIDRIVDIVGSLLSFSSSKDLPAASVNLTDVIPEVVLLLKHSLTEKNIDVRLELPEQKVLIVGDENRIKQLLINLLTNSIDAVLEGGQIAVKLASDFETGFAEIRVVDNGYGIPEDIQDRIFNPFFSSKINKKNTGLGLSICRNIVDRHKGFITFESKPGRETVFKVRLPLLQ